MVIDGLSKIVHQKLDPERQYSFVHFFSFLCTIFPDKITIGVMKVILQTFAPPESLDVFKHSPLLYSVISDNVALTSLIFDFVCYKRKKEVPFLALKNKKKLQKFPDFKIILK